MTRAQAEAFVQFCNHVQFMYDQREQSQGHTGYERLDPTPAEAIELWADLMEESLREDAEQGEAVRNPATHT